jgi:dihydroorotate dehydrogenase
MLYQIAQKALFATDPERAHYLAMESLRLGHGLGATRWLCRATGPRVQCMGLDFPNVVGAAAGLDKNADYFEALGDLGFGFVEVGTVTPRPQPGNPKPRIFRLPSASALINRLGFNNKGIDYLVTRVAKHHFKGVLGINIGKNFDTPIERAADDYLHCLEKVYPFADYVAINVSSPNTRDLRTLQSADSLAALLGRLARRREKLEQQFGRRVPMALKVAPDLSTRDIADMARVIAAHEFEAVIATNTTIARPGVQGLQHADESGGLSGSPLKPLADEALAAFRKALPAHISLIGVGGITTAQDALDKLHLGAKLLQIYTGMIYRGPALLSECLHALALRSTA